ncbi:MAG: divalent-cation tolerance protein CutA [Bdellovibrionales bacterium]
MSNLVLGYVPCSDSSEARKLARLLVNSKLIACANIVPGITSIFNWNGEICEESETLLLFKSSKDLEKEITNELTRHHTYDVPNISFLSINTVNDSFSAWVEQSLKTI